MDNLIDFSRSATLADRLQEAANARSRLRREVTHEVVVASDGRIEGYGADSKDLSANTTGSAHALTAISAGSAAVHNVSTLYLSDPEPRRAWWRRSNPTDSGEMASPIGSPVGHPADPGSLAPIGQVANNVEILDDRTTEYGRNEHDVTARTIRADVPGGLRPENFYVAFRPMCFEPVRPLRDLARNLGIIEPVRGHRRFP